MTIILSSLVLKAQTDTLNLPKYYIVDNDTIGVIMSIEQCQRLDHNTELLELYRKMSIDCDNVEKSYIIVINKLGDKIAILEVDIKNLKNQNDLQRDMIGNLQNQIEDYKKKDQLNNQELSNKDQIISGLKSDLRKQKMKTALGFGGTVLATVGFVVLLIVGH
jgi:predicted RNase H-like nuclease (RuvC/YqgF family)